MSNATSAQTPTIPATSFDFDKAPLFADKTAFAISHKDGNENVTIYPVSKKGEDIQLSVQDFDALMESVPGHDKVFRMRDTSNGVRINYDAIVTSPGQPDVEVKRGGVLLKSTTDGALSFFSREDFDSDFERVLKDKGGSRVELSEPRTTQANAIRLAGDATHLRDLTESFAVDAVNSAVATGQKLFHRAVNSEAAGTVQETLSDLRDRARTEINERTADLRGASDEVLASARSGLDDARTQLDAALHSQVATRAREGLKNLIGWGMKDEPKK